MAVQPIVIHGKFDFTVNYCDQTLLPAVECHFLLSSSSFHSFNFFAPASSVLSSYKVIKESKYSWTSTYDHLLQAATKIPVFLGGRQGFSQKGVLPSYGHPFLEEIQDTFTLIISYNFMEKHAFWTAVFNVWLKA